MFKIIIFNLNIFQLFSFINILLILLKTNVLCDYSLECNKGYRVSAIRRVNSIRQRGKVGSINIECQPLISGIIIKEKVKCSPLENIPQCNGQIEGCKNSQWIGGFNIYEIDNITNAILLDPICCESKDLLEIDQKSCVSERLNFPKLPFEHSISAADFVYRGLNCWHQYHPDGTTADLIFKIEICQIKRKLIQQKDENYNKTIFVLDSFNLGKCPLCDCHNCGINLCGNGDEPIRVVHKHFSKKRCACDCICRYECIEN
ncbi:hypothetical protein Mgra_00004075 [Meloidogyne graminicola]|uniref:Uncharacterized protein n=1 Tax=Meloidogyne graminicola TaxID=189291 RepID=A0A8S9ZTH7_9BILA|nr:hypothetical protein Mgra_00004075 [Meloidogyne graminicola]